MPEKRNPIFIRQNLEWLSGITGNIVESNNCPIN